MNIIFNLFFSPVYSDKDDKKKIFDRLEMPTVHKASSDAGPEPIIKITGLNKSMSSVFGRLGGKDGLVENAIVDQSRSFSGILKNAATIKAAGGVAKKQVKPQKVILVKKQPAKAVTMDSYSSDNRTENGEKSVSFSSEDEILEIAPRPKATAAATTTFMQIRQKKMQSSSANVKDRLGFKTSKSAIDSADSALHRTRKMVALKPNAEKRKSISPKMQSDIMTNRRVSVKSRLCLDTTPRPSSTAGTGPAVRQLARLSLQSTRTTTTTKSSSSVFQRLGFTD